MQTGYPGANPQLAQNASFQQPGLQFQGQNPAMMAQNQQFQQQPQGYGQPAGLISQATGFPGQQQMQGLQSQPTGYPGGSGFLQSQPTGFVGAGNIQRAAPPPPPVPQIPSHFHGQSSLMAPQNRFLTASPGLGGGLMPQRTGFPAGGAAPLVPQVTGWVDPRIQMMSSTFMPMNTSAPYGASGAPQLPPQQLAGGLNLQQSFQQHNQQGNSTPQVSWALSKAEKKSYDSIFRAWDANGSGFINGQTALEVFGQSGLSKDALAQIWCVYARLFEHAQNIDLLLGLLLIGIIVVN